MLKLKNDDVFFLHPIDQHYNSQENFFKNKLDCSFDSYNSEETELSKFDYFKSYRHVWIERWLEGILFLDDTDLL